MVWPVQTQVLTDSLVISLIPRILPGHQILRNDIVIAALGSAKHRVQHTADQFNPADDQPIDVIAFEKPGERTLPAAAPTDL